MKRFGDIFLTIFVLISFRLSFSEEKVLMEREILKCVCQVERFGENFWQMLSLFPLYISRFQRELVLK